MFKKKEPEPFRGVPALMHFGTDALTGCIYFAVSTEINVSYFSKP